MATTFKAINFAVPMPSFPGVGVSMTREFAFTLAAALVDDDIIKWCTFQGARAPVVITDYYFDFPDLDTGGTPAIAIDLGTSAARARFVAAATIGQSAGKLTPAANGVTLTLPDVIDTSVDFQSQVETAPQTGATTGTIRGWVRYHFIGAASPV